MIVKGCHIFLLPNCQISDLSDRANVTFTQENTSFTNSDALLMSFNYTIQKKNQYDLLVFLVFNFESQV